MILCSQCGEEKEQIEFLWLGRKDGFTVKYCNACAAANMAAYYANRSGGKVFAQSS